MEYETAESRMTEGFSLNASKESCHSRRWDGPGRVTGGWWLGGGAQQSLVWDMFRNCLPHLPSGDVNTQARTDERLDSDDESSKA